MSDREQPDEVDLDDGDDGEIFGVEKKKAIVGLVAAAVLSLGAVAVLGQVTSYGKLLNAVERAEKLWLPLTLLGQLVAYTGYVIAYRDVARADGGPCFRLWTAGRVVGLGLGAYVIGASAGGLTVDFWAMRRAGSPTHEAARRTLALNTLHAAGLALFAVAAGVVVLIRGAPGHAAFVMTVIWLCVVPAAVAGAWFLSRPRRAERIMRQPEGGERPSWREPARWPAWLWANVRKGFGDAIGGVAFVRLVFKHPLRYHQGLLGYPLFWLGDFFTLWVALRAFGVHLAPDLLVIAEASAWALTLLPLPAGGSGIAEATVSFSLNAVGVPLSHAIFAALTYRAVNFWLPILPALGLLTQVPKLQEELPQVEHAEEDEDVELHPSRT